jgi:hypothetical protein
MARIRRNWWKIAVIFDFGPASPYFQIFVNPVTVRLKSTDFPGSAHATSESSGISPKSTASCLATLILKLRQLPSMGGITIKLIDRGTSSEDAWEATLAPIREAVSFTLEQARLAGDLVGQTRPRGLSLGDRACLALGIVLKAPVYTADRSWKTSKSGFAFTSFDDRANVLACMGCRRVLSISFLTCHTEVRWPTHVAS